MPSTKTSPDEPVSHLRRIPIHDSGEPLVDFMELSPRLYWVPEHPVFNYQRLRFARQSLAEMLARAAESLPDGLRLAIVECWRPPQVQQQMHEHTRDRWRAAHPDWSDTAIQRKVNRFSAPMNPRVPPPHTTGGAVDLHLIDADGQMLDFVSPFSLLDSKSAPAFAAGLSQQAQRSRALLREALLPTGLTNYPAEWWHWSYGDQGWAYRGGHPHALYAAIDPPGIEEVDLTLRLRGDVDW